MISQVGWGFRFQQLSLQPGDTALDEEEHPRSHPWLCRTLVETEGTVWEFWLLTSAASQGLLSDLGGEGSIP